MVGQTDSLPHFCYGLTPGESLGGPMNHHHPHRTGCSRFSSPWPALSLDAAVPLPVAEVDPINDAPTALVLIDALASDPPVHETLAILLDREHRGSTIVHFDGTVDNDSVLWVADQVTEIAHRVDDVGAVVIASFRPRGSDELDDVERWLTIDEQLGLVGVELIEWFVIGRSVSCPRSLLGDASRWVA
jgi:hypothetical protein